MWQYSSQFLQEWLERPSWIASVGIGLGLLLYLTGVIWKRPRDKKRGILTIILSILIGILLYFYG